MQHLLAKNLKRVTYLTHFSKSKSSSLDAATGAATGVGVGVALASPPRGYAITPAAVPKVRIASYLNFVSIKSKG